MPLCQSSEIYRVAEEGLRNEQRLERWARRWERYLRAQLDAAGYREEQPHKDMRHVRRRR